MLRNKRIFNSDHVRKQSLGHVNNSTFVFEGIQSCAKNVISHKQPVACGLSRISYAYLTWVAMWDRFFQQRAYIGITRSCMRWYVRKKNLTWVKTTKIPIWCARKFSQTYPNQSLGKIKQRDAAPWLHVEP